MRIVVALGGNALLRRGEPLDVAHQRANIVAACRRIAEIVPGHEVVIAHGNGPQVGLLALQQAAYAESAPYPLDVLGAETEAMIGYLIEQELGNLIPLETSIATILTQVEVAADDPAFAHPTKPIGPVYDEATARELAVQNGWAVAADGPHWRRVVPSPRPQAIVEIRPIRLLLEAGSVVICAGGGGIPTLLDEAGDMHGVEAVIDKDHASALLAAEVGADLLVIATDVDGVYAGYGGPDARRIVSVRRGDLDPDEFPEGSMGPKIAAALDFVSQTGGEAVIGSLEDIAAIVGETPGGTSVGTRFLSSQS